MEGKSQNASGSSSAPRSAGISKPLQHADDVVGGSGAIPTNTTPQIAGGSGQTTVTLSLEALKMLVQWLKPDADATQLLTQARIIPTSPPIVEVQMQDTRSGKSVDVNEYTGTERMGMGEAVEQRKEVEQQLPGAEKGTEEPTAHRNEVLEVVRQINAEAEQSSIAEVPEEIQAESIPMGTATMIEPMEEAEQPLLTPEVVAANLVAGSSEAVEINTETDGDKNVETPGNREVVIVTDERKETNPAAVRTYQRRAAREETSGRKTPGERTEGGVVPSRRKRRVLIDEEPEEEEDVIFTLIEELRRPGQIDPPAEVDDIEKERKEIKRKGKAIATPLKKKPRRQRTEEEALRMERRSKRSNDGARSSSEQRPEMARIKFKKMQVRLDNDLLGRIITFKDPLLTKECKARVGQGKKAWSGRCPNQEDLQELEAIEEFMEFITGIGFDWLLFPSLPEMPMELAQEFFTSFHFTYSTDVGAESISFRLFTREMRMSIREWSVRLGLYTADQEVEWFERDIGTPREIPEFSEQAAWEEMVPRGTKAYQPTASTADCIRNPILRLAQVFVGANLLCQSL